VKRRAASETYRQAVAAWKAGRLEQAERLCTRVLGAFPDRAPAWQLRGRVRLARRDDGAQADLQTAARLAPADATPLVLLTQALLDAGRAPEAAQTAVRAVERQPNDAVAWSTLGNAFQARGELSGAETAYRRAVTLNPGLAGTWSNLSAVLRKIRRGDDALTAARRALALEPRMAAAHANLGNLLGWMGRSAESVDAHRKAAACAPDSPGFLANLGNALRQHGQLDDALDAIDAAIAMAPDSGSFRWNRAITLLMAGDYQRGMQEYRWRHHRAGGPPAPDWLPHAWTGEPADTLLLHTEQGFGDALQFVRFAADTGCGRVVLSCHPRLREILASAPGIDATCDRERPPGADARGFLMDLPAVLDRAPDHTAPPYLRADPARVARWAPRVAGPGLRVGIGWQGNPEFEADERRSPPLSAFAPVARVPGVKLLSLQKRHGLDQLTELAGPLGVEPLGRELDNGPDAFVDTAAVMTSLDLIITSDTATAHLAGALGVPTWVVLCWSPDWRWGLSGDSTPWYPNMRLFRQPRAGDWTGCFSLVSNALKERLR